MEKEILKLTNAVYKVLEFFPESDPLKNRAKDKALVIAEHINLINQTSGWASFHKEKAKAQALEDIDVLLGYLWIGKSQGWLNSINCLIISNEYEKIKKQIEPKIEMTLKLPEIETPKPQVLSNNKKISERQKSILEFLKKNEKAQVMDLQTILPNVTKRTIRRDLEELLKLGEITRLGGFNGIFYQTKG